jgi:CheY-like chemotaxis protein
MSQSVGLLLSDDLLDVSRITGTARAQGLALHVGKTVAALLELAKQVRPTGVLVDLQHPGLDLQGFLTELRAACGTMPRVVAFGSHVEAAVLRAARQAGCDPVLPRSAFVAALEADLPGWLGAN